LLRALSRPVWFADKFFLLELPRDAVFLGGLNM
jgi:hypothetical protein